MITERTLKRWRREALQDTNASLTLANAENNFIFLLQRLKEINERVIRLTGELLDQHLLRKR